MSRNQCVKVKMKVRKRIVHAHLYCEAYLKCIENNVKNAMTHTPKVCLVNIYFKIQLLRSRPLFNSYFFIFYFFFFFFYVTPG
jgi:hypothetical protein